MANKKTHLQDNQGNILFPVTHADLVAYKTGNIGDTVEGLENRTKIIVNDTEPQEDGVWLDTSSNKRGIKIKKNGVAQDFTMPASAINVSDTASNFQNKDLENVLKELKASTGGGNTSTNVTVGGYKKPTTPPAEAGVKDGDTLNVAIGKLEYGKADKDGTLQTNLNADMLDGKHADEFATVGINSPNTTTIAVDNNSDSFLGFKTCRTKNGRKYSTTLASGGGNNGDGQATIELKDEGTSVILNRMDINTNSIEFQKIGATKKTLAGDLQTTEKINIIGAINEVFQNASNGKQQIVNAITGKGGTANANMTFQQLATAIINTIPTGLFSGEYWGAKPNYVTKNINPTIVRIRGDILHILSKSSGSSVYGYSYNMTTNRWSESPQVSSYSKTNVGVTDSFIGVVGQGQNKDMMHYNFLTNSVTTGARKTSNIGSAENDGTGNINTTNGENFYMIGSYRGYADVEQYNVTTQAFTRKNSSSSLGNMNNSNATNLLCCSAGADMYFFQKNNQNVFKYNTTTDTWTFIGKGISGATSVAYNPTKRIIYLFYPENISNNPKCKLFDVTTNAWNGEIDMPVNANIDGSVYDNGMLYIIKPSETLYVRKA